MGTTRGPRSRESRRRAGTWATPQWISPSGPAKGRPQRDRVPARAGSRARLHADPPRPALSIYQVKPLDGYDNWASPSRTSSIEATAHTFAGFFLDASSDAAGEGVTLKSPVP
jgi:hypothetical protein